MEDLDVTDALAPDSDQLGYADVTVGTIDVTVERVEKAKVDARKVQLSIFFREHPGRPLKPGRVQSRLIASVWGKNAREWAGGRLRLYGDPTVKYGGKTVGGVRISHMSGVDKPMTVEVSGGKGPVKIPVQPLADPALDHVAVLQDSRTMADLQSAWTAAQLAGVTGNPAVIAAKDKRKNELAEDASADAT